MERYGIEYHADRPPGALSLSVESEAVLFSVPPLKEAQQHNLYRTHTHHA